MKTIKAPRTNVSRSVGSIPALLLLGALSGTALAATDIQEPCPDADARKEVLTAFIAEDTPAQLVRTVDAKEPAATPDADDTKSADSEESDSAALSDSSVPAFTTRLPGVSASDMPGFRRHMYRTDI